jgi:O-antigen ligase
MTSTDPRLWFPGSSRRAANPFLEKAGLAGLALYAAMLTIHKDLCYAGEWLMLLALAGSWSIARDRLVKDAVFRLGLVWTAYLAVSCLVGATWVAGSLGDQVLAARRWMKLGFIVLVAWWLGGDWRAIRRLYAILFIAFALAMVPYFLYPLYWEKGLAGGRLRFGMNPQRSALFFATALLGLLFLARDVWGHRRAPRLLLRLGLWVLAVLLMTMGLLFTQTRGVWLGIVIGLGASVPVLLGARSGRHWTLAGGALGLGLVVLVGAAQWGHIAGRFGQEAAVFQAIEAGQWQSVPNTSLGRRIHLWHWGWAHWQESPWLGIGINSIHPLAMSGDLPQQLGGFEVPHLHNSWLELLVATGLIGVALFIAFAWLAARGGLWAYRQGHLPGRFLLMQWSVLVMFLVANFSEAHLTKWIFWPYLALFWGSLYSPAFWFRPQGRA